ncbi:MAG TPA: FkbM family methyltransferase [Chitinophagaceae bacterium]|nr:FkbM family methyltransferase [Chitinophagaceae bacterium]
MSAISKVIRRYGFSNGLCNYFQLKRGANKILLRGIKHPVYLRSHTSDRALFKQIFYSGDYDIPVSFQPRYIIDGGANIGFFSILFANRFPDSKIAAIEPDTSNYGFLKKNVGQYPNIHTLQTAIWDKQAYLKISVEELDKCAIKAEEVADEKDADLKAMSIADIIAKEGFPYIDILKLDIEGAEKEVFSSNYDSWLPDCRMIIVELHDFLKQGCSNALLKAVGKYDFSFFWVGENFCLMNNSIHR